jgi:hypothetical protein
LPPEFHKSQLTKHAEQIKNMLAGPLCVACMASLVVRSTFAKASSDRSKEIDPP